MLDPLVAAPLLGCSALGWASGIIGASLYLRRQSLLGETLSHASYPGIMVGALFASMVGSLSSICLDAIALFFALVTSLVGVYHNSYLEKKGFSSDGTCSFVLASYMGVGILMASILQFQASGLYLKMQSFLMGQAATMQPLHTYVYIGLAAMVTAIFMLLRRPLLAWHFDRPFFQGLYQAKTGQVITGLVFVLSTLVLVLGLRGVGVVLMPALLICPAVCASYCTRAASRFFALSALFGALMCFFGILTSFAVEQSLLARGLAITIPSGPFIVVVAILCTLAFLLFSPSKGLVFHRLRMAAKRQSCLEEDILKSLYRIDAAVPTCCLSFKSIKAHVRAKTYHIRDGIENLILKGYVLRKENLFSLTDKGKKRSEKILKLHALWTLYLTRELGMEKARLDLTAAEIEGMLDQETAQRLLCLLKGGEPVDDQELLELIVQPREKRGLPCFSQ